MLRWIVPLAAGPATPGGAEVVIDVGPDGVTVRIRDHVGVAAGLAIAALPPIGPVVACQLGQALQDASRCAALQTAQQRRRRSI